MPDPNNTTTLNIELHFLEAHYVHDEGFVLSFAGVSKNDKHYTFKVKCGFCSLGDLADEIWKMVHARERAIEGVKMALIGRNQNPKP